jgi:hypothetical protein
MLKLPKLYNFIESRSQESSAYVRIALIPNVKNSAKKDSKISRIALAALQLPMLDAKAVLKHITTEDLATKLEKDENFDLNTVAGLEVSIF